MTSADLAYTSILRDSTHDPPTNTDTITTTFVAVVLLDNIHRVHGQSSITIDELIAAVSNCKEVFFFWTHPQSL
jgi:hypothetical protein